MTKYREVTTKIETFCDLADKFNGNGEQKKSQTVKKATILSVIGASITIGGFLTFLFGRHYKVINHFKAIWNRNRSGKS